MIPFATCISGISSLLVSPICGLSQFNIKLQLHKTFPLHILSQWERKYEEANICDYMIFCWCGRWMAWYVLCVGSTGLLSLITNLSVLILGTASGRFFMSLVTRLISAPNGFWAIYIINRAPFDFQVTIYGKTQHHVGDILEMRNVHLGNRVEEYPGRGCFHFDPNSTAAVQWNFGL